MFGFQNTDVAKNYRQVFLRIPQKLLKNNESVVVGLLQEGPSLPATVLEKPQVSSDDIECFCVCRLRDPSQRQVSSDSDLLPEQLIFCRRQDESLSLLQD